MDALLKQSRSMNLTKYTGKTSLESSTPDRFQTDLDKLH